MQGLAGAGAGVIYNLDSAGRTAYVSSSVRDVLGWEASELRERPIFDIVPEEDQETLREALIRTLHGESEVEVEFRAQHRDGTELFVEATMIRAGEEGDTSGGVLLRFRDVTQRKTTELQLRGMVRWFRALTRYSGDVIIVLGADDAHRFVSGSSERVLGHPPDELTREVFLDGIHPRDRMGAVLAMEGVRHEVGGSASHTFRLRHRDGSYRHVDLLAVNRYDDPDISGLILYLRDVTEQQLRDDLTELPNRRLFIDRLQETLEGASEDAIYAVARVQLERHPMVRGTLGPELADKMVVQFARRLQRLAADGWTVARIADAGFAILLVGLESPLDAESHADEMTALGDEPYHLAAQEVCSNVQVGVCLSSRGYSRADAMLRDAEAALQAAKAGGKTRGLVDSGAIATRANRLLLEGDLVAAMDGDEFRVNYQPIWTAKKRRVAGFEALVRWNHPRDGLIMPGRFIAIAEETGLIVKIGAFVLRRSCQQLVRWSERVPATDHLTVSVNLSAVQLRDPGLVELVEAALTESGLAPERLRLEVTETALIDRPGVATRTLSMVRDLGVRVSLDDFGTGYSSLSYLSSYPFDVLKIDRSFVSGPRGLTAWDRGQRLVEGIVRLAHSLGLTVVGEGVEDEAQARLLTDLGCDLLQGFHLARPAGPKTIRALLEGKR